MRPARHGRYRIKLDPTVRGLLQALSDQLVPVVGSGDPATKRLFPPAYVGGEHEEYERDYRELVGGTLSRHHEEALATLAKTATAESVDADELTAWLSAIGTARLIIGTRLDVSESMVRPHPSDPDAPLFEIYELLSWLQGSIVEVLAGELPDEGIGDDPA